MNKYQKRIPDEYRKKIEHCGTIEVVEYTSKRYAEDCSELTKKALVYLPYGYDESKNYKVLYLMHGGGGDEEEFLYGQDGSKALLYTIDHMIENGELEPLIIVTPTFYYYKEQALIHPNGPEAVLAASYPKEFRNDLIPFIEAKYPIIKDREHRAFGGFSMGSVTTWNIFVECADLVAHFMPLSGDSWINGIKGCHDDAKESVEKMAEVRKENGMDKYPYNIFAFTGDGDIAFPGIDPQMKCMIEEGWGTGDNEIKYVSWTEGEHCYDPWIYHYVYNVLPELFGKNG